MQLNLNLRWALKIKLKKVLNDMYKKIINVIKKNQNLYYFLAYIKYIFRSNLPTVVNIYLLWYKHFGFKRLNIKNPKTFNEKIQWLKLFYKNPLMTKCADKFQVREYVAEKIGYNYLNELIAVYESPEKINWDKLPKEFVIKLTHDSGSVVICRDKENIDRNYIVRLLKYKMKMNYAKFSKERCYIDIKPRVVIEKYFGEVKDYKVFCFYGKPKMIQVDIDRFTRHVRNLYTPEWEWIDLSILYPKDPSRIEAKPKVLEEMLSLSSMLSEPFPHVRVDWYIVKDKLIFGEMTFYHGSGFEPFDNEEWEYKMGEWLVLPVLDRK